ncbi:hypothetical protein [Streptomyces sp. NPDC000983]|uniref:hypothetical protein n=1 Tax=Streptomyces sp. NPDC000983 TaxID=3154373 RepID=UPI003325681F
MANAAREAEKLLGDVADGLARGRTDASEATDWHRRALRLERMVGEARSAVGWSRESLRGNPRRRSAAAPHRRSSSSATTMSSPSSTT